MKKPDDIDRMIALLKKNRKKSEEASKRLKSELKKYDKLIEKEESIVREIEAKYFPKTKVYGKKL